MTTPSPRRGTPTARQPWTVSADAAPLARSILSCPAGVSLAVDGVDDVLADLPAEGSDGLTLQDVGGVPTFSVPSDTRLTRAAAAGRRMLLTLTSALGRPGSPERDLVLTIGGRLRHTGIDRCECCTETRETAVVVVDLVVLARGEGRRDPVRVPAGDFGSPALALNPGFLQRAREHSAAVHHDELRLAAAYLSGTPLADVLAANLTELTAEGAELQWVDPDGSHLLRRDFPRRARTHDELGELLRAELHPGLC